MRSRIAIAAFVMGACSTTSSSLGVDGIKPVEAVVTRAARRRD